MMRRFGRRWGNGGPEAIDASQWLPRLLEAGVVPATSLEAFVSEGVPTSLAALGGGDTEDGHPLVVAFAPRSGRNAILAALAAGAERAAAGSFAGGVALAVAPSFSPAARRLLAITAPRAFAFEVREAAALSSEPGEPEPESVSEHLVLAPERVAAQIADASQREVFARAALGLAGLAAKHAGSLRGVGGSVELVLLARRVAALRADEGGISLDSFEPERRSERLLESTLADALDRLEGLLRKRLNDRRVRDGDEGLRARAIAEVANAAGLRALVRWPLPGGDPEVLDFAALDAEGRPVAGAIRRRVSLASLGVILDGALALRAALPVVFAQAAAPVRVETPRLMVAAEAFDDAALRVLAELSLEVARVPLGSGGAQAPETLSDGRRDGGRRRGRRGRRGRSGAEPERFGERPRLGPERPQLGPELPRFEEPSHEPERFARDEGPEDEPRGPAAEDLRDTEVDREAEPALEPERRRFEEVTAFDLDDAEGQPGPSRRRGRRRRRGGGGGRGRGGSGRPVLADRPQASAGDAAAEEDAEEDEAEREVARSPAPLAPDEREEAGAAPAPELPLEEVEAEPEPAPPERPRRAAILVHADRDSVAAALLLARETRILDGVWVYPQEEIMTFFRGVATDLRDDVPIFVIGFTARPARDVLQAASLYRGRLIWIDHHEWPPEDLEAMRRSIGEDAVQVVPGLETPLPLIAARCTRRSRFSDKLVDLATARFSEHDFTRWGRLWWSRLDAIASRSGDRRSDVEPLLTGRPSDLSREAARLEPPPLPRELAFATERDFELAHFGGYALVRVPVPPGLDLHLAARIARERHLAPLSLAWREGGELVVLAGEPRFDVMKMADHLAAKHSFAESLPNADHVARLRVHDLDEHPERLDALVAEIAMGRSILEG